MIPMAGWRSIYTGSFKKLLALVWKGPPLESVDRWVLGSKSYRKNGAFSRCAGSHPASSGRTWARIFSYRELNGLIFIVRFGRWLKGHGRLTGGQNSRCARRSERSVPLRAFQTGTATGSCNRYRRANSLRDRLHLVCLNLARPENDRLPIQYFNDRGSNDWWIQAVQPDSSIRYLYYKVQHFIGTSTCHGYRWTPARKNA